jgi:hypothetical protein
MTVNRGPRALRAPTTFFDRVKSSRDLFKGHFDQGQVDGLNFLLAAMGSAGWSTAYAADGLATAFLETGGTMEPVREAFWLNDSDRKAYLTRMYDPKGERPGKAKELGNTTAGDGVKFGGAGYVQVTGKKNFATASAKAGIDFVKNPEKMLEAGPAAAVMISGMGEGWFTGRSLEMYFPADTATREQFRASRAIINGTDRDDDLARYALAFQDALVAAGWA